MKKAAKSPAKSPLKFRRILLKLSGEVLRSPDGAECISPAVLDQMVASIREARDLGAQIGIVIGGGNIFRGLRSGDRGIPRTDGDNMGMLATMINSLALEAALLAHGIPAQALSARAMPAFAELFSARRARELLSQGTVVIMGGGSGAPFFSTDSAAALRAAEIGADLLLKATKVDGIYSDDPVKNPAATRFDAISFANVLAKRLKVMDSTAFALCQDNDIPVLVFDFFKKGELLKALRGRKAGTLVSNR